MAPKKISAKEVMLDIRAGLSNHEIGKKYGLSEKGIQSLFDKLYGANLLTEEEHSRRLVSQIRDTGSEGDNGGPAVAEPTITRAEAPLTKPQPLRTSGSSDKALHTELNGEKFEEAVPQPGAHEFQSMADGSNGFMHAVQIRSVGKAQRLLLWAVLASFLCFFVPFSFVLLAPFQLYCVWNLAKSLDLSTGISVLYLLLMFIPIINTIALLMLNNKATQTLRKAGIRVGLMGARPSDLPAHEINPWGEEVEEPPTPIPTDFIDVSNYGKNQWWRYLVSIVFIVVFSVSLWGILVVVWAPQASFDKATSDFIGISPLKNYVLQNVLFVFILFTLFLAIRYEHKRPFLSLISPNPSVDWLKLAKSFGLFFFLILISLTLGYASEPAGYRFNSDLSHFFAFLPVVLVLTPIQTTVEELLFRGYFLQMIGLLIKNRYLLIVVCGVLFMLLHLGNPEMAVGPIIMALNYFVVGAFLTFVTWKSNSLEVAMGIHAATNLSAGLIVNYENSALKTESLFFCTTLDPVASLVSFFVIAAIFYFFMFGGRITMQKPWLVWARTG
ncbi:CPBP family intramembrane glutamic endopeptidase [Desulfomonile tiedjei]|uniref:Putative metal-dependent membrane protease n=1 Tax=Desulfomonile tiedjei (strain ATCC 49306 / DSM 6799 / DCB-1) TaxID=706587 RepID=I4CD52_DESTA|nr:type II CAAX endopeptidase family protein [Desulfomonile tiedjei]AFM27493.1 putative metal-dependent membrane protease [Desulfomonile tiedjei DSM 6799]